MRVITTVHYSCSFRSSACSFRNTCLILIVLDTSSAQSSRQRVFREFLAFSAIRICMLCLLLCFLSRLTSNTCRFHRPTFSTNLRSGFLYYTDFRTFFEVACAARVARRSSRSSCSLRSSLSLAQLGELCKMLATTRITPRINR